MRKECKEMREEITKKIEQRKEKRRELVVQLCNQVYNIIQICHKYILYIIYLMFTPDSLIVIHPKICLLVSEACHVPLRRHGKDASQMHLADF